MPKSEALQYRAGVKDNWLPHHSRDELSKRQSIHHSIAVGLLAFR
jgi:hypothetical protein